MNQSEAGFRRMPCVSPDPAVKGAVPDADTIRLADGHEAFLQDFLPNNWRAASEISSELARSVEFLAWRDRCRAIDEVIWGQARQMLSNEEITAVINRLNHSHGACYSVLEYSTFCSAIVTAVVIQLKEPRFIRSPHHAMTFLLSRRKEHQDTATAWVSGDGDIESLQNAMSSLPGYAFLFMTLYSSDSAESFMARDAFWRAMLGG